MPTLSAGSTQLRTLPQLEAVDTRPFALDIDALARAAAAPVLLADQLGQLGTNQRRRRIEKIKQPSAEQLARLEAAEAVEDFPVQRGARAIRASADAEKARLEAEQAITLQQIEQGGRPEVVRGGLVGAEARRRAAEVAREKAATQVEIEQRQRPATMIEATEEADISALDRRNRRRMAERGQGLPVERIVETPEGRFLEEVVELPGGDQQITRRRQQRTAEEVATTRQQTEAQAMRAAADIARVQAETEAAKRRGIAPRVVQSTARGRNGATLGVIRTIIDPVTGDVQSEFIEAGADSAPGSASMVIPGAPAVRAPVAAPAATIAVPQAAPVVAPVAAPAAQAARVAVGPYVIGQTYRGLTYLGGDPNQRSSWQAAR